MARWRENITKQDALLHLNKLIETVSNIEILCVFKGDLSAWYEDLTHPRNELEVYTIKAKARLRERDIIFNTIDRLLSKLEVSKLVRTSDEVDEIQLMCVHIKVACRRLKRLEEENHVGRVATCWFDEYNGGNKNV